MLTAKLIGRISRNETRRLELRELGSDGMIILRHALQDNWSVDEIVLESCHNDISFWTMLSKRPNLGSLTLKHCGIDDTGAKLLAQNPAIAVLALPENNIGDAGAIAIATHSQATDINLAFNRITGASLRVFGERNIAGILDVQGNDISGPEIGKLLRNTKLSTFTYAEIKEESDYAEKEDIVFAARHSNVTKVNEANVQSSNYVSGVRDLELYNVQQKAKDLDYLMLIERMENNRERVNLLFAAFAGDDTAAMSNLLTDQNEPVLPYGPEIKKELPNNGSFLHVAVDARNKNMLKLLLSYLPRSEYYVRDDEGRTYEELADDLEFELLSEERPAYLNALALSEIQNRGVNSTSDRGMRAESSAAGARRIQARVTRTVSNSLSFIVALNLSARKLAFSDAEIIASLDTVRFLYLNLCSLDTNSARWILSHTTANVVELASNNLEYDAIIPVPSNPHIYALNLHNNRVGNDGAIWLGDDNKLVWLDLSKNSLTDESAEKFGFETHASYVDLSENHLTNASMPGFATNKNIATLQVNDNKIGNQGIEQISGNSSITTLGVERNLIGNNGVKAFEQNNALTYAVFRNESRASQVKSKIADPRGLYSKATLAITHAFNHLTNAQHTKTQAQIERNREKVISVVEDCIAIITSKDDDHASSKYNHLSMTLSGVKKIARPYGFYVQWYLSKRGYSGNLLHLAVRGKRTDLLSLLLSYMPRHAYFELDDQGFTYERLADHLGFVLNDEDKSSTRMLSFTQMNEQKMYYATLFVALRKSYEKARMVSEGVRADAGAVKTLLRTTLPLLAFSPVPYASQAITVMDRFIELRDNVIIQRAATKLSDWFENEDEIVVLAKQMFAFYQDTRNLSVSERNSCLGEIKDEIELSYYNLGKGKIFTRTERLALMHVVKLCDYMSQTNKPTNKPFDECCDNMIRRIFPKSHQRLSAHLYQNVAQAVAQPAHPQVPAQNVGAPVALEELTENNFREDQRCTVEELIGIIIEYKTELQSLRGIVNVLSNQSSMSSGTGVLNTTLYTEAGVIVATEPAGQQPLDQAQPIQTQGMTPM